MHWNILAADSIDLNLLELFEIHGGRKIKVIESIADQWRELAKALGFETHAIDHMANTYPSDYGASCEMFSRWLGAEENLALPASWTTLIQCLIDAGLVELAEIIKESMTLC